MSEGTDLYVVLVGKSEGTKKLGQRRLKSGSSAVIESRYLNKIYYDLNSYDTSFKFQCVLHSSSVL
jgi:hypothetical protein